jgi:hypothetical protein
VNRETKFKQFYKALCNAALGINIGLIIFAFITGYYVVVPLAVINSLLLSVVYVIDDK